MKILIAVPTYENIYPDTFKSIYDLDRGGHETDFQFVRGYDVANARNQIGRLTLDGNYDYCLMIDNDEVVPKDALVNLIETEQKYKLKRSMAVGYSLTRPPNKPNTDGRTSAFKWGGRDYVRQDAYTAEELRELRESGAYKVQIRGSGLACALIHRDVFEEIKYPWFKWVLYDNGSQLSEDLYFCEQFNSVARPIFVDTRVTCGHLMRHIDFAK
jgi:hypothetical protein